MKFEKTKFGKIWIDGKKYNHDVYLYSNGTLQKRDKSQSSRIDGHRSLSVWELENVIKDTPNAFLIGMG